METRTGVIGDGGFLARQDSGMAKAPEIEAVQIHGGQDEAGHRRNLDGFAEHRIESELLLFTFLAFARALAGISRVISRGENRRSTEVGVSSLIETSTPALAAKEQQDEQNATDHGVCHAEDILMENGAMSNRIVWSRDSAGAVYLGLS